MTKSNGSTIPGKQKWVKRHPIWWMIISASAGFVLALPFDFAHLLFEHRLQQRDRVVRTEALIEFVDADCKTKFAQALTVMETEQREEDAFYQHEIERLDAIASGRGLYESSMHEQALGLAKVQHEDRMRKIKEKPRVIREACDRVIDSLKNTGGLND